MIRSDVGVTAFSPPVLGGRDLGAIVRATLEAPFADRDLRVFVTVRLLGTAR